MPLVRQLKALSDRELADISASGLSRVPARSSPGHQKGQEVTYWEIKWVRSLWRVESARCHGGLSRLLL